MSWPTEAAAGRLAALADMPLSLVLLALLHKFVILRTTEIATRNLRVSGQEEKGRSDGKDPEYFDSFFQDCTSLFLFLFVNNLKFGHSEMPG